MTTKDKIEAAATLAAVLMEAAVISDNVALPHHAANDALALLKIGGRMTARAVRECNEPMTKAQEVMAARAEGRDLVKACEIAKRYGATVHPGEDPRGFGLFLKLPTNRFNSFGGPSAGWGV